jgi:hypothetical protein
MVHNHQIFLPLIYGSVLTSKETVRIYLPNVWAPVVYGGKKPTRTSGIGESSAQIIH